MFYIVTGKTRIIDGGQVAKAITYMRHIQIAKRNSFLAFHAQLAHSAFLVSKHGWARNVYVDQRGNPKMDTSG